MWPFSILQYPGMSLMRLAWRTCPLYIFVLMSQLLRLISSCGRKYWTYRSLSSVVITLLNRAFPKTGALIRM
ncbi:hypothetical protein DER44DRAFT_779250 [Fusarium oxysporum]|nr:hypothetical protein DER44DRAFT_779250 [Fusarium oxysporum]